MPSPAPSFCFACTLAVFALAPLVYLARARPLRFEFPVFASAWPTSPSAPLTGGHPQARPAPAPLPVLVGNLSY
eukprot:6209504-Pleurochrysis_carterae.AAC.1